MRNLTITELRKLLGVDEESTPDQIERAYRKKALKAHPDKGGDPELFKLVKLAHKLLLDPSALEEYNTELEEAITSHSVKIDAALYQAQFTSYNQWLKHSLMLVKAVRFYRRGFSWFMASDIAAEAFLKAVEARTATRSDLMKFIEGDGSWDSESTKTVFFELLHGPITSSRPEDKKASAIRWVASLGDFSFTDNPNASTVETDFFIGEFKHINARQFAIDIELGYLARHLSKEEFGTDALVKNLLQEQTLMKIALENICSHIHMRDTIVTTWAEKTVPLAAELQQTELNLLQIAYQYALIEIGLTEEDDAEEAKDALIIKRDAVRLSHIMLQEEAVRFAAIEAAEREAAAKALAEAELLAREASNHHATAEAEVRAKVAAERAATEAREAHIGPISAPASREPEASMAHPNTIAVTSTLDEDESAEAIAGAGATAALPPRPKPSLITFYNERQRLEGIRTTDSISTTQTTPLPSVANVVVVEGKASAGCGCSFWR